MLFAEFDSNPNFVYDDYLSNVVARLESHGSHRASQMDFVRGKITNSLMRQLKKTFL